MHQFNAILFVFAIAKKNKKSSKNKGKIYFDKILKL